MVRWRASAYMGARQRSPEADELYWGPAKKKSGLLDSLPSEMTQTLAILRPAWSVAIQDFGTASRSARTSRRGRTCQQAKF